MEHNLCYRQHLPDHGHDDHDHGHGHGYDCCMPMTYLCQWFLFCRGLPAPETWCPLLPGGLTMVIIILVIMDHADSDHYDYDRGGPPLNHPHHQHHHQKITIISINIATRSR